MKKNNLQTNKLALAVDVTTPKYKQGDILQYRPVIRDPIYYHILSVKVVEGPSYHYVYMDLHNGQIYETHMLNIDQYATVSKVQ
jgi:hypothetical protein